MIWIIVTLEPKPEMEAEFLKLARNLHQCVADNEPDLRLAFCQDSDNPSTYIFVEEYATEAALAAHRQQPYVTELGPRLAACLSTRPETQMLRQA